MGCYIRYSKEGDWARPQPTRPLLAVPNVTAHPSTASVPITVSLCNGDPLLCGFNVPIKGLTLLSTVAIIIFSLLNKFIATIFCQYFTDITCKLCHSTDKKCVIHTLKWDVHLVQHSMVE